MANNTGNPIGSTAAKDLSDNAESLDKLLNGEAYEYTDRLGRERKSLQWMEDAALAIPAIDAALRSEQQAERSESEANRSGYAKSEAEAARDAAQLSAGVYSDIAAGLVNTASGKFFSVPSTDSSEYLILYKNNAGAAIEVKRYPSALAVDGAKQYANSLVGVFAPLQTTLAGVSIAGNSTSVPPKITASPGAITKYFKVEPGETYTIAIPALASRFRILQTPVPPEIGSVFEYADYLSDEFPGSINFTDEQFGDLKRKTVTTTARGQYLAVYVSNMGVDEPLYISQGQALTKTKTEIASNVGGELFASSVDVHFTSNDAEFLPAVYLEEVFSSDVITDLKFAHASSDSSISVVVPVEPDTTYTLKRAGDTIDRFRLASFAKYPTLGVSSSKLYPEALAKADAGGKYYEATFTTGPSDKYLAFYQSSVGIKHEFALFSSGKTAELRAVVDPLKVSRHMEVSSLRVGQLDCDMIVQGKNLFDGVYQRGYALIGSPSEILQASFYEASADRKDMATVAVVPIVGGRTYTVSRNPGSDRFRIGFSTARPRVGSKTVRYLFGSNDSALYTTVTALPDEKFMLIYASRYTAEPSRLKVEEGASPTGFEAFGFKFKRAAVSMSSTLDSGAGLFSTGMGDGVADDTDSLEGSIAVMQGIISFDPAKKYRISRSLTINAAQFKEIRFNGTTFTVDGDFPAFIVKGTLTGTANPNSSGSKVRAEKGIVIDHLRAYALDGVSGAGICLQNTFGARVTNCDLVYMKNGIQVAGQNRNMMFSLNHIYACADYGILFDSTCDLHQVNIGGNIITYCRKNIFGENANIYNIQITGNDLENGSYAPGGVVNECNIHFLAYTGMVEDVEIVGNTIEDHWVTQVMIKLEGLPTDTNRISAVTIAGNVTGNSAGTEIQIGGASGVDISGQFKHSRGYTVDVIGNINGLKLGVQAKKQAGGLFRAVGDFDLRNVKVCGSSVSGSITVKPIHVDVKSLRSCSFSHNDMQSSSAVTEAPVDVKATTMRQVRVDGNNIDNDTNLAIAIRVEAGSSTKGSMVGNMAYSGAYSAPESFTISNNT